jgi:hypothetical protein
MNDVVQRKMHRELPAQVVSARDVPRPVAQATGYFTIRQTKDGVFSVNIVGDTTSTTQRVSSLNELFTLTGDWASGQFNEQKE